MTQVAVFILTPAAQVDAVVAAVAHLTPGYILGFSRVVVPISPEPTTTTTPTHYRAHDAGVDQWKAVRWQAVAIDGALPPDFEMPIDATMTEQEIIDAMAGVTVELSNNVTDSTAWAAAKLAPDGLRDRPEPEW